MPKDMYFEKDSMLQIEARGYFKEQGNWSTFKTKIFDIYPNNENNMILNLNHPTDSIDIYVKGTGTIICLINDYIYKKLEINKDNKSFKFHRIKFTDPEMYYTGKESKYLPKSINENTMNFSRVDQIKLIMLHCNVTQIYQHCYKIYSYPERYLLYN